MKATKKAKKASSYPPATSLLIATSTGIVEIVNEILRVYPQAVEHVSDMGQNILHVVIKHRKLEIFKRVKKMHLPTSRLVRRIDDNGYTILHHVGVMMYYTGGTLPGPALQLQEELRWFERVRKIIPPHYAMHKSQYGQRSETAEELFRRTHEKLLKEAQEWLKRTSESCSAVAVLIATVAFAAAYTVPGGSNQDTGVPILLTDPFFLVFTIMDVLSLASSLTSVVMFLSILTSPFELQDFRHSLPRKLILAFTFLFFSVAVTMLAFAATIILIIHLKKRWTTSIIYAVAFLPVTMFALLQFPLYMAFMDTMKSTLKVIKKALPWYTVPRCLKAIFSKTRKTL
ncbi:Ankyrin repeat-containing protein [Parasponia andersonii]|uniref:Ankyrin repeat-containing protein n=1 Tax=Parasponia andersonii TaxID=3476 RepID=A0A2P5BTM1_PARAD|nr:Ankyrin repeat-containing protein [Parasponia andersonii]